MTEEIFKEICNVKNRINDVEIKLSRYTDRLHNDSTESIAESQSAIIENEISAAELLAVVSDLVSRVEALESTNETSSGKAKEE